MQSLRHILVGTDFSRCAEAALECATTLANASLAKVTVVHVCEPSIDAYSQDVSIPELDDAFLRVCRERLESVVARHASRGVEVESLLRIGRPWDKLNNAATEVGASLIAIGRNGYGDAPILGTVADQLLRTASRPVVVVPLAHLGGRGRQR